MFDIYATSACYELVHVQTAMAVANVNSNANDMNNNEIKKNKEILFISLLCYVLVLTFNTVGFCWSGPRRVL